MKKETEIVKLIKQYESKKLKEADFLALLILQFKTRKQMLDLLYSLLTRSERKALAMRVLIVKMLKAGEAQHKISAKLKVGVLTVTRGAAEIQKGRFEFM